MLEKFINYFFEKETVKVKTIIKNRETVRRRNFNLLNENKTCLSKYFNTVSGLNVNERQIYSRVI